jgi:hypothetical protein
MRNTNQLTVIKLTDAHPLGGEWERLRRELAFVCEMHPNGQRLTMEERGFVADMRFKLCNSVFLSPDEASRIDRLYQGSMIR